MLFEKFISICLLYFYCQSENPRFLKNINVLLRHGASSDCSVERMCDATDCKLNGFPVEGTVNDGCVCVCAPNWTGPACDIPRVCDADVDCNGNGVTTDDDATDGCDCEVTGYR